MRRRTLRLSEADVPRRALPRRDDAELGKHAQLVQYVPALDDLAVGDAGGAHHHEASGQTRRREPETIAAMRARRRQPVRDPVAFRNQLVDADAHVRKGLPECRMEGLEPVWAE